KRRTAHERLIRHEVQIRQLINKTTYFSQPLDGIALQAVIAHFQFEVRSHGGQVDIATAFADAIDGSLYLDSAVLHCSQCIGHADATVVVGMDADEIVDRLAVAGRGIFEFGLEFAHDLCNPSWQRSAV